jgi:uncharacterized protein YaiL (DUF2058 family)
MTTKTKKTVSKYTLASVADKAGVSAKGARAKFRRLKKERPFDHTKVSDGMTAAQAAQALKFLKTDYRHV